MKTIRSLFILALCLLSCDDKPAAEAPAGGDEPAAPATATVNPATVFEHPDGVYRAAAPQSWGVIDNPKPGPYGTYRLTQSPDFMISFARVPQEAEIDLVESAGRFFQTEKPIGEPVEETLHRGRAVHRMYGDDERETPWRWWIRVVHAENQLVTITVSDAADRFDAAKDEYLAVVKQVEVLPVLEIPNESLPTEHTESDVERVLERTPGMFWGRAKDDDGVIEPQPPETKDTRLIEGDEALAIVQEAVDVGLAQWCDMPWKPVYFAYQDRRRKAGWSERKVAYAGTLFGSSQGRIQQRVKASVGACTEAYRRLVERRITAHAKELMAGTDGAEN